MLHITIRQVDLHAIVLHHQVVDAESELQADALFARLFEQDVVEYRTQNAACSGNLRINQGRAGDKAKRVSHDIANLNALMRVASAHDLLEHAKLLEGSQGGGAQGEACTRCRPCTGLVNHLDVHAVARQGQCCRQACQAAADDQGIADGSAS